MTEQQNTRPSASREIAVKKLVWEWPNEYGLVCRAVTPIGTYSVSDDEDRPSAMFCYLHLTDDGDCTRYAVKVVDDYLEPEEAQAAAQADYERRILSAIDTTPGNTDPMLIAKYDDELRKVQGRVQPDWEGFGRAITEDWPTGDIDGSDLFDMSLKYGLIAEIPGGYNPDEHIDSEGICPERGDPWYEYTFRSAPTEHPTEQPSVRAGAVDAVVYEARFLVDRLKEYEADGCQCDESVRQWNGHVSAPLERLEMALSDAAAPTGHPTEQPSVRAGAVDALAAYQQADQDGIMVLVSRQAIEECLPALRSLAQEGE